MKLSIDNASEFRNQFIAYNRDNFSCQGYEVLFDFFEELDSDMVLDVIAICCEYSEDDWADIADNYGIEYENDTDGLDAVRDYLEQNTTVVGETASGFVYACF